MNLDYTRHAVERFEERFPELKDEGVHAKVALHRAFQGATRDRSFLNDTRRIAFMVDKYGDFNYDFYIKGKVVFVVRDERCITVIHRDDTGMTKMFGTSSPSRFRKKSVA
jgi:hypothetical protein